MREKRRVADGMGYYNVFVELAWGSRRNGVEWWCVVATQQGQTKMELGSYRFRRHEHDGHKVVEMVVVVCVSTALVRMK